MIVIYAEKPDLGRKIAKALGVANAKDGFIQGRWKDSDTIVTWGFGHMCSLKQAKDYNPDYRLWSNMPLPFIPGRYEIMPKQDGRTGAPDPGVIKQLRLIRDLFLDPENNIINATDFDREGDLIFAYICDGVGFRRDFKRVSIDSLTDEGIRKAFDNLKDGAASKPRTMAGRARSIADWVVGINLTVAATRAYIRGKGQYSVGRVQTATLAMLVEREKAINGHSSAKFYTVEGAVTTADGATYKIKHQTDRFDTEAEAAAILAKTIDQTTVVSDIEAKVKTFEVPLLYSQTTLQMAASSAFGMTLKDTLAAAQSLYEKGFTTYPRTSSQHLTSDMRPVVTSVLRKIKAMPGLAKYIGEPEDGMYPAAIFDDSQVESHYAIIPTGKIPSGLSKDEAGIFELVALSVIRLMYPEAQVENTTVKHEVNGEIFLAKGSRITELGWFAVDAKPKLQDPLPDLHVGDVVMVIYEIVTGNTKPPKRYTDKTLVAAMATAGKTIEDADLRKILCDTAHTGIGTDATRAGIVETLVLRGYIRREKKMFFVNEPGMKLIEFLPVDDLKSPVLTAQWEQRLMEIERGQAEYKPFIKDIEDATTKWCQQVATTNVAAYTPAGPDDKQICPHCKGALRQKNERIFCSNWSSGCKFAIWPTISGVELSDEIKQALLAGNRTELVHGFAKKDGSGTFDAFLQMNPETGKIEFSFSGKP